jgi:hypothetical protein
MEMRRHYLGNRGENEGEIQQSENELTGQADPAEEPTEEEPVDDAPPPLEDIDTSDKEEEEEDQEKVETPAPPIADCGMPNATMFLNDRLPSSLDIPFIRPPLQNVISRSSTETIFGGASSKPIYPQTRSVHFPIASFRDDDE